MFISPALEELTEASPGPANNQQRPVSPSTYKPPMDESDSRQGFSSSSSSNRAGGSSEVDNFQRELARQLAGVDEQTFQKVKEAIQTVSNQRQDSTHEQSLLQVLFTARV